MRRRHFLTLLAAAVTASHLGPRVAGAQPRERMRRIGVLIPTASDDPDAQARIQVLAQGLLPLGWTIGGNVRLDIRWSGGSTEGTRKNAADLVAPAPDVILAHGGSIVSQLLQVTRTVPVVFVAVPDPVGAGFVDSLPRPGRNATGFTNYEFGLGGKWLELLKQIAPNVTRAAILRDPLSVTAIGLFGAIQSVAPPLGMEVSPIGMDHPAELERAITAFARSPNGGLIVTGSALASIHRELILGLAARHKLPAVFYERTYVANGGLISYGPNYMDQYRRAASYVDRILRGEKPSDLPVQAPVKYETVLNLRTAKALGLDVPAQVLVRADEVIE